MIHYYYFQVPQKLLCWIWFPMLKKSKLFWTSHSHPCHVTLKLDAQSSKYYVIFYETIPPPHDINKIEIWSYADYTKFLIWSCAFVGIERIPSFCSDFQKIDTWQMPSTSGNQIVCLCLAFRIWSADWKYCPPWWCLFTIVNEMYSILL